MGTLTADIPRLDAHCPHKLATSCRLTSTPNCCACADERAHSRTYRVYIDGVGFVQRGTRWQGYCWFCKEFWTNRLAATDPPLETSQTRVPEIPDQTEFLERWWEFYQGYRTVTREDGTEHRIAVLGEPFKEVSPGFLPRTLAQLRAGVENDATRSENRLRRRRLSSEEGRPEEPQQSLDEALDSLLQEASDDDEAPQPAVDATPQPLQTPEQTEQASQQSDQPRPLNRGEARLQRARERFARVFGTREDLQQENYESPLSTMFNRASDRYRQAEERRATDNIAPPPLDGLSAQERREIEEQLLWGVMRESASHQNLEQEGDVWSYTPRRREEVELADFVEGEPPVYWTAEQARDRRAAAISRFQHLMHPTTTAGPSTPLTLTTSASPSPSANGSGMTQVQNSIEQITSEIQRLRIVSEAVTSTRHSIHARFVHTEQPVQSLDSQPDRPEPLTDEEMTRNLSCRVCYQQLADIAVLPCGHMVMCQWCADVVIPVKHSHLPVRMSKCPMCRKQVKQRFKIHM
jgi:hypothetical protein